MREEHKNYNEWWSVASFADILCVGHGLLCIGAGDSLKTVSDIAL